MGIFRRHRKDRTPTPLQRKRGQRPGSRPALSPRTAFWWFVGFVGFTGLLVVLSFAGLRQSDPQIVRDQTARERVIADFAFDYESEVLTQRRAGLARERIPPFYEIRIAPFQRFARELNALEFDYSQFEQSLSGVSEEEKRETIATFVREFAAERDLDLPVEPTVLLLSETTPSQRNRLLQEALQALESIYRNGIIDEEDPYFADVGSFNFLPIQTEGGDVKRVEIQRPYDARISLRNELADLTREDRLFNALYEILGAGIVPNLEFNAEKTRARRDAAATGVDPVRVQVAEGATIIEPGQTVSATAYEKLVRYRQEQSTRASSRFFFDPVFQQQTLLALMVLLAAVMVLRLAFPELADDPRRLGTIALLVLVNVAAFRSILHFGASDLFGGDLRIMSVVPYAAPVLFGPLTVGILLGPLVGALTAFVIAAIFAIMLGENAFLFLAGFISALSGIFLAHNIRLRTNVVRAAFFAGLILAGFIVAHGALLEADFAQIGRQVAAAVVSASVTGVVILGFLPLLEKLFNYTTDITLLEYTDFNHPLLRRMQVEAPGSYHHSLMVASLSENAAAGIGANPLACRACALFHDIGKMVKPEYFTENQSSGHNPLIEQKPSMSAVIIKRHVKEGVELARKHKLPRIFVDIIQQHHGTTLIQYFYREAINRRDRIQIPLFSDLSAETVEETTYRYDGPKPRFIESAIIFFADSIEAASRSLPKVNSQSVGELLDRIFQDRIEDGQLDECPLTLQQMAAIKKSFSRTLLNSLHSRIAYPAESKEAPPKPENGKPASPADTDDDSQGDPDNQQV